MREQYIPYLDYESFLDDLHATVQFPAYKTIYDELHCTRQRIESMALLAQELRFGTY